eukprot:10246272-Lingulodinium_polyedra.AAC.1
MSRATPPRIAYDSGEAKLEAALRAAKAGYTGRRSLRAQRSANYVAKGGRISLRHSICAVLRFCLQYDESSQRQ